jgi:hypothetical protein
MPLNRFVNESEVLSTQPVYGETYTNLDRYEFKIGSLSNLDRVVALKPALLELHIYDSENTLLKSSYKRSFIQNGNRNFGFSPEKDLRELGYDSGIYTMVYNPIYNFVGSSDVNSSKKYDLTISEISGDRTEIRISNPNNSGLELIRDIQNFNFRGSNSLFVTNKPEFLLNCGDNFISDIAYINFVGEGITTISLPKNDINGNGFEGKNTEWKPTTYPESERGVLFREFFESEVNPTGRLAFFKLELGENNKPVWVQELYTETGFTGGYTQTFPPSALGSPFYLWERAQPLDTDAPSSYRGRFTPPPPNGPGGVYINFNEIVLTKTATSTNVRLKNSLNSSLIEWFKDPITDLYIKLTSPLDGSITIGQSLSIDGRLQKSYIEKIIAYNQLDEIPNEQFLEPNFNIELDKYGKSDGTDFKAWNDLLDVNLSTSQQIIDEYFSGSFGNIKLNIDYSDFTNFIHYSSATERIDNFFNKLQTIEGYNTRISVLQQVSGSHALTNISQSISRRNTLIGGFDGFEKWMYNKVTGSLYTHYSTTDNPITPYPKISTYPIVFYPTTSSQAESWYAGVYSSASLYDSQNQSALINLIPFALREDILNEDYVLFINMIGQHFDILWTYTKALTDINKREEHPEDGISDDLLYDVAKSMGWYLSNGWGDANLWEYTLGTDSLGSQSQTIGGLETKSKKKISSEVWRRVLNNLPYIYKSKGTPRSIKALLACYGIPSVFLKIREYGGPTIVESPNKYEAERFIYKVETTDSKPIINPFGTINGSRPNTIEIIGKMPLDNFTIGRLTGGGTDLDFEWNYSGGQARILAKTGSTLIMSSSYMNYRVPKDGAFGIISGSSTTIRAAFKDDFGNILASLSATSSAPNSIFGNSTQFIVGDGIGNYTSTASIQEVRYYSSSLSEEIFQEHALNTEAYFSDDNTTDLDSVVSYTDLVYRIFPDSGFNTISTAISSSHPNQFFKTTLSGASLTASLPNHTSADLVGEVDTQFIKVPSIGTLNLNNNKIRIESSVLSGSLDVEKAVEVSQYDYAPLDSNLVGLYFSSTDVVNNDIYNSEGYFEVDDWIGDPDDRFNEDYSKLRYKANIYFQKYVNLTAPSGSSQKRGTAIGLLLDMLSLYDHSIFQQVKQLIPARSEYVGGVLLEPHILERNKYKRGDKWGYTRNDYLTSISMLPESVSATKNDYLATLDVKDYYESSIYKYTYPILSGSTGLYTNVSNPYWEYTPTSSIMNQRLSPHGKQREFFYSSSLSASLGKYYSSSLIPYPSVQTDELPLSLANLRFNGCNSGVTSIDGQRSVEIFIVDPFVLGVAPRNISAQDTTVSIPPNRSDPGSINQSAQDTTVSIPPNRSDPGSINQIRF